MKSSTLTTTAAFTTMLIVACSSSAEQGELDGGADANPEPELCGNDEIDEGETCDGDCPTECVDDDACIVGALTGSAADCSAECVFEGITECNSGDGCCPEECNSGNDSDCTQLPGWAGVPDILSRIEPPTFPDRDCPIIDFGAVADGSTDASDAVHDAIAACHAAGGGRVVVGAGEFLVERPIHLESNIELHLEQDAQISFGAPDLATWPVVLTRWEGTLIHNYSPLIYAYQKTSVAITGSGEINGNAAVAWSWMKHVQGLDQDQTRSWNEMATPLADRVMGPGHFLRPSMIQFFECENLLVEGVHITDSPFWSVHLVFSRNATVRHVSYDAQNWNNDGVDVDSSEDVLIENVAFNNKDDNICIKSGRNREGIDMARPSRNVVVRDCTVGGYNAIAIGSEMSGGVSNVFVERITATQPVRFGIYIKANRDRGGEVSNIWIRDVQLDQCDRSAIALTTDYKNEGEDNDRIPFFHDITIEEVSVQSTDAYGLVFTGQPEQPITQVHLRDVTVVQAAAATIFEDVDDLTFVDVSINGIDVEPPP